MEPRGKRWILRCWLLNNLRYSRQPGPFSKELKFEIAGKEIFPPKRRNGYASEMLGLILPICRAFGESKVLLTCDKKNEALRRTIIKNGGVLENEVDDTVGLSESGMIQRYWILLQCPSISNF